MIDCSTNIIDLINNHPEQVRTALGIGDNDNFIILQPTEGEYAGRECIFTDNRVDDYIGNIIAYVIIGIGYEPSEPAVIDGMGETLSNTLTFIDAENNIYRCDIKGYSCNINSGLFVRTQRQRFWVNAYVCEEGRELGVVEGGQFIEYGGNVMLRAIPGESDYTVTWTDTSDPAHPIIIDNHTTTHTINSIVRNYSIETCFIAPPPKHTLRIFTNDGKISNLNLTRMIDGYKLGDVRVDFILEGTTYTIDTNNCDYGQIKTFDFDTALSGWINNNLDRGIILYNVPNNIELSITSIVYSEVCCYTHECSDTMTYTSFKGFYSEESENDYNDLGDCELQYPIYEWELYSDDNTPPNIDGGFIHSVSIYPDNANCCDYFFIEVPTEQQGVYNYYYRNTVGNTIYLNSIECYGNPISNQTSITISSMDADTTYYAVFEPKYSKIILINKTEQPKVSISIEDYCECTNNIYTPIPCNEAPSDPPAYAPGGIPTTGGPEYIQVNGICYHNTNYRETGAYALTNFTDSTIYDIVGSRVGVLCTGDTQGFIGHYEWVVSYNQTVITNLFEGESMCEDLSDEYYNKCVNFYFTVCSTPEDTLSITLSSLQQ